MRESSVADEGECRPRQCRRQRECTAGNVSAMLRREKPMPETTIVVNLRSLWHSADGNVRSDKLASLPYNNT